MRKILTVSAALVLLVGALWLSGTFASIGSATLARTDVHGTAPGAHANAALDGIPFEAMDPTPDPCPATFASCTDVLGKSCRLETGTNCTVTNTHENKCTQQDQSVFECPPGQKIMIQNCGCEIRLQNTCCDNCPEFTCGSCENQPGSQSWFCE